MVRTASSATSQALTGALVKPARGSWQCPIELRNTTRLGTSGLRKWAALAIDMNVRRQFFRPHGFSGEAQVVLT